MGTQICVGFTDDQWKKLRPRLIDDDALQRDEQAWTCAIKIFERRMQERFLSCIEALEKADSRSYVHPSNDAPDDCSTLPDDGSARIVTPGFAIMALCSLLLETLQSFRDSKPGASKPNTSCTYPTGDCIRPKLSSSRSIKEFLKRKAFGDTFKNPRVAGSFVHGIRNGILHDAETRGWVIKRDKPKGRICERQGGQYVLNRTRFHRALQQEFKDYLEELRDFNKTELRKSFLEKMDNIVEKC